MTRMLVLVLPLVTSACFVAKVDDSGSREPPIRAVTYSEEKRQLVLAMERRMNELTRDYSARIAAIQQRLRDGLAALAPPVRLAATERVLSGYGAAAAERYDAAIDRLVDQAVAETEALIGAEARTGKPATTGEIEREVWRIAAEVGGRGQGAGYGLVSGVVEVDERAAVTIELLKGLAELNGLRAEGALRKGELIDCAESFRHDLTPDELAATGAPVASKLTEAERGEQTRVGRLYLFASDTLEGHRMKDQESMGFVVAYFNERLPADTRFDVVQLVRYRVSRGGMIVEDLGWQLDTVNGQSGVLPQKQDLVDSRYVASEPFFPAVNVDHSQFERLRDFTVIFDYKSMVVERGAGSVLGAIDWQLQWNVSMTRQVRFVGAMAPMFDTDGAQTLALASSRGPRPFADLAHREPSPSDLVGKRSETMVPANELPARELEPGVVAPIAEAVGSDHLRITEAGRKYLLAHRLAVLADQMRFMRYLEGQMRRFVLAIIDISDDSPAHDLGFRDGDAIVSVNGQDITRFADLFEYLAAHPKESRFEVGVLRDGAFRRLIFDVFVPSGDDVLPDETLSEGVGERLNSLLLDGKPEPGP